MGDRKPGTGKVLKGLGWLALVDALEEGGCPVCGMVASADVRYLRFLLYEGTQDVGLRVRLVASTGSCGRHARRLLALSERIDGDHLAIATLYESVLDGVLRCLEGAGPGATDAPARRWGTARNAVPPEALAPAGECPACAQERDSEVMAVRELLAYLDDEDARCELQGRFPDVGALCLPHLRAALEQEPGPDAAALLRGRTRELVGRLRDALADYPQHRRGDAPRIAAALCAGDVDGLRLWRTVRPDEDRGEQ